MINQQTTNPKVNPNKLRVMIAIPTNTGRMVFPTRFMLTQFAATIHLVQHNPDVELVYQFFGCLRIDAGRQQIVQAAKDKQCDILIMCDDDMDIPEHTYSHLCNRIIKSGMPIVTGLYRSKGYPFHAFVMPIESNSFMESWEVDQIYQVRSLGTGCIAIAMWIFDKIPQPYFLLRTDLKGENVMTEDCYFASNCFLHQIPMYCDTTLIYDHLFMDGINHFLSNPYIHWRGEEPISDDMPTGNIHKLKLIEKDYLPDGIMCQDMIPNTKMTDGIVECGHKNVTKLPINQGKPQFYKCEDCGIITEGVTFK